MVALSLSFEWRRSERARPHPTCVPCTACVRPLASPIYGMPCKTNTAAITRAQEDEGKKEREGGREAVYCRIPVYFWTTDTHKRVA